MHIIYIKIHNATGKKYLGKTTSADPHRYKGSGKLWKRHIAKHGYDVTTRVIYKTECKDQLREAGLIFSKLFDVVESKEFLNLMEESGDGGNNRMHWTEEQYSNWRQSLDGHKKKNTKNMSAAQKRDSGIKSAQQKEWHSNPENRQKKLRSMAEGCQSVDSRKKRAKTMSSLKWCNDGTKNYRLKEIPEGYSSGRLSSSASTPFK